MSYAPENAPTLISRVANYLYFRRGLSIESVREEVAKQFPEISPLDRSIAIESGVVLGEGVYEVAPKNAYVSGGGSWAKDYRRAECERDLDDDRWHIQACVGTIDEDGTHRPRDAWYAVHEHLENPGCGFRLLSEAEGTLRRILMDVSDT